MNGEPLVRPADLSPEMMVREGLAFDFKDKPVTGRIGLAIELSKFKHDGQWDAERISSEHVYVRDYHDPANQRA